MSQLAQLPLFEGPHVPRMAARDALSRGDLRAAHAKLAGVGAKEEAADAARLARIDSALNATRGDPVEAVHGAFASALAAAEPRGFLSGAEWFRPYALREAGALEAEPGRRFRGWLGAHFAFAAAEPEATRRAVARVIEVVRPGSAWIEAARLAFVLGEAGKAGEWIHTACLDAPDEIAAEPPALERCGVPALDAAPPIPPLPSPLEEVFEAARALEGLPGPWTRWIAVVGEIDRVLAPASGNGAVAPTRTRAGRDGPPDDEHPARAFLAALRAARRSRERDRPHGSGGCSDRELRARRRMQRLAPELLARYLHGLGTTLL